MMNAEGGDLVRYQVTPLSIYCNIQELGSGAS
jgi:hypothetical protein